MRVSVCMCLSVHDHVFGTARPIFAKIFAHVTYCVTVMRNGKIREFFLRILRRQATNSQSVRTDSSKSVKVISGRGRCPGGRGNNLHSLSRCTNNALAKRNQLRRARARWLAYLLRHGTRHVNRKQ